MHAAVIASPVTETCSLRSVPIRRESGIAREEFECKYMTGTGCPVIVTDAADGWPAMQKWNFRWLAEKCGHMKVVVKDDLFNPSCSRIIPLRRFLVYCEHPWTSPLNDEPVAHPFYTSFKPFVEHPDLMDDFAPPYFFDNIYEELPAEYQAWYRRVFGYLFVGPKGTVTPLHVDIYMTHAWLTQIVGRKHMILFSPADAANIYDGAIDPLNPDLGRYPLAANATAYEAVLEPGETILFPAGWYHYVRSLDPSISLSFNGVNHTNFVQHILSICRGLPRWAQLVNLPEFSGPSGVHWTREAFDLLGTAAGRR
jgi:hypothetical protein